MKRKEFMLLALLVLTALFSCTDEYSVKNTPGKRDDLVRARFSLGVAPMQGQTKTRSTTPADIDENLIQNIWLLQYQGGSFVTKYFIGDLSTVDFEVELAPGLSNLYFVANVSSTLFASPPQDEATFFTTATSATSEEGMFFLTDANIKCIPMFAQLTGITVPVTGYLDSQTIEMTRLLARIDFTYTLSSTLKQQFAVDRIRLCNVRDSCQYYPPQGVYPAQPDTSSVFDTAYEPAGNDGGTLTFYVPENLRGTGDNATTQPKYKGGVDYATYIELQGLNHDMSNAGYRYSYRIYPGGDNYNDYNIRRNHYYTLTSNLTGLSISDSRVTRTYEHVANTYVLYSNADTAYINVQQANRSELGIQIPDVTSSTAWTPVVLWAWTTLANSILIDTPALRAYGKFGLKLNGNYNACVGIQDAEGNILWSWLVWVAPNLQNYIFDYNGYTWMGANIGQTSFPSTSPGTYTNGLVYQWGRKDPFNPPSSASSTTTHTPPYSPLAETLVNNATSTFDLEYSIRNPTTFVRTNNLSNHWLSGSENEYTRQYWSETSKTLYDPCPEGWRVPPIEAYQGFSSADWTWSSNSYMYGRGVNPNVFRFLPTAYRSYTGSWSNSMATSPSYIRLWTCSPYTGNTNEQAYRAEMSSSGSYSFVNSFGTANALPIRCVKEK